MYGYTQVQLRHQMKRQFPNALWIDLSTKQDLIHSDTKSSCDLNLNKTTKGLDHLESSEEDDDEMMCRATRDSNPQDYDERLLEGIEDILPISTRTGLNVEELRRRLIDGLWELDHRGAGSVTPNQSKI